jgi:hypothetical protein
MYCNIDNLITCHYHVFPVAVFPAPSSQGCLGCVLRLLVLVPALASPLLWASAGAGSWTGVAVGSPGQDTAPSPGHTKKNNQRHW